jgi:hypothetical protein
MDIYIVQKFNTDSQYKNLKAFFWEADAQNYKSEMMEFFENDNVFFDIEIMKVEE